MKNQMIFAILMGLMLFVSPVLACETPVNDTSFIVNTSTIVCSGTYSNVSIIIDNNNGLLDLNNSVFIGDQTGVGISINGHYNQFIHNGTFTNYETGIQLTDANNTDFSEIELADMEMYGINTYRSNYSDFSAMQIFNSSTGARFNDNSEYNTIGGSSFFEGNANYGLVLEDSGHNIISDSNFTDGMYGIFTSSLNEHFNSFINNDIYNFSADCVYISSTDNTSLLLNRIDNCGYSGIVISTAHSTIVSDNNVSNSDLIGEPIFGSSCIQLQQNSYYNIISGNTLTQCTDIGLQDLGDFMNVEETYNLIHGNLITYSISGIFVNYNAFDTFSDNIIYMTSYGMTVSSNNHTLTGNNISYSDADGLGIYGADNILIGGSYCYNNQTAGVWYDIYDDSGINTYSGVYCDTSDPLALCDYPCGYVPPVPSGVVWPLTSTIFILITILVTVALGMEFAKDTSRYEYLATLMAFLVIMGIAISVVS